MDKRDWKQIYRRVKSKPVFMKDGRPSSALFKDSHGVSVDKDMGRNEKDIISDEERLHRFYNQGLTEEEIRQNGEELRAIISLSDESCDLAGACVLSDPIEGENLYHALLQKSENEILLTKAQARMLARAAVIVKTYSIM